MEWISVGDNLPTARQVVLFAAPFGHGADVKVCICFGYKDSDDPDNNLWYDMSETDRDGMPVDVYGVTHWMPLPAPPSHP
jgi:hypothetical protein